MAWYDDMWEGADEWLDPPPDIDVNDLLFSNDPAVLDQHAQDLFVEAFFNGNDAAYIDLVDYMWEQYHMDFEDAFDWEDFRDWYDSQ